jgi:hypothetical protein
MTKTQESGGNPLWGRRKQRTKTFPTISRPFPRRSVKSSIMSDSAPSDKASPQVWVEYAKYTLAIQFAFKPISSHLSDSR